MEIPAICRSLSELHRPAAVSAQSRAFGILLGTSSPASTMLGGTNFDGSRGLRIKEP